MQIAGMQRSEEGRQACEEVSRMLEEILARERASKEATGG